MTVGGIVGLAYQWWRWFSQLETWRRDHQHWESFQRGEEPRKPAAPKGALYSVLIIVGALMFVALSGATQVPATHFAVVENTWTGQFFSLGPVTHIFPFEPRLWPLVSRVFKYDLRRQIIEIGEPTKEQPTVQGSGVQADSNSPGRPVVYVHARGWSYPNREKIIELHRRYGPDYLNSWVERVWVSSLKGIQGQRPYDFVGNFRVRMQDEVEKDLQAQLLAEDEQPIVIVSQLAIVNFGYDPAIEGYLDQVAQKEFERQSAEQQILINQKLLLCTLPLELLLGYLIQVALDGRVVAEVDDRQLTDDHNRLLIFGHELGLQVLLNLVLHSDTEVADEVVRSLPLNSLQG
jgi:hypothetical protein